jgi:hypothetical protein
MINWFKKQTILYYFIFWVRAINMTLMVFLHYFFATGVCQDSQLLRRAKKPSTPFGVSEHQSVIGTMTLTHF